MGQKFEPSTADYEYRGLMAATWDYLRGDPSGRDDRDYYWAMIQQYGEPVLDVGCGTGRLLVDLLASGLDIDGVDISPEMLAICETKALKRGLVPRLYAAAIETMSLSRRYRTIIAPSSVLQLITDVEDAHQAVTKLHEHLLPGGALIAPFMTLWRAGMLLQREWENAQLRVEDGALLQRMGRVWYDPQGECEHTEDLYQVLVEGEVVAVEHHRRSPASRSYSQAQAHKLFVDAGFLNVNVRRGFTYEPVEDDDMLFTVVAVRDAMQGAVAGI